MLENFHQELLGLAAMHLLVQMLSALQVISHGLKIVVLTISRVGTSGLLLLAKMIIL